jgi:uncharacterized protein with ParB-like and HNH nuclease domain
MTTSASTSIQEQLDSNRQKVDVDYFDVTLREIVRMASEGELKTSPEYQRKFRWKEQDEAKLIESLFLGLPVPSIFVATNKDGTWEVVDGLQRVSTILHFVAEPSEALALTQKTEPLRLSGLTKLTELNDKSFADINTALRLAFLKRMLRVTALSDKSDPNVRFDMFERLNNGGIALTPQEVRACIYRNEFMILIEELAEQSVFKQLIKLQSANEEDGTREEVILKMFAYLNSRSEFTGRVKDFLNSYVSEYAKDADINECRTLFERVIELLTACIQGPVMRRNVNWTPINQLEAVLVATAELVREGCNVLSPKEDWLNDTDLVNFSTGGTNTRTMLNGRIKRAKELLSGAEVKTESDRLDV